MREEVNRLEKSDKLIVGLTAVCALLLFSWLVYDIAFLNPLLEGQIKIGKIYEVQNRVKRKFNRSLIWYPADQNEIVYENDWIFTGSQSIAKIKLDSGGEIVIEPDSLIILSRKNGVLQLDLQHGRLLADVKKGDVKINVIRDGEIESVDTSQGVVSVAQDEIKDPVEIMNLDTNGDGEDDLSLSDLADQKHYDELDGYSKLNEHGLSYKKETSFEGELLKGEKADVDLKWIDPFNKWDSYQVEVATDPNFENMVAEYAGAQPHYNFKTDEGGMYHWRIRGLDAQGNPSEWTGPLDADVNINYKAKDAPLRLAREKMLYQMKEDELSEVATDRSYALKEERPITISWEAKENANQYKVEISDSADFSNILEEKFVKDNTLDLESIKLGETFFRVVPETKEGIAMAEPAVGKVRTYLPAPKEESLKTIDKETYQIMKWEKVPFAEAYEVSYKESKTGERIKEIVTDNKFVVQNGTGFLQWKVRVVDPETKKHMSSNSATIDWYDSAKRLASLHGSGLAGALYPVITKPEPRKTFISTNGSPLFIVMNWRYVKNAPSYEVEISKKSDMSQLVYKKTIRGKKKAVINKRFKPGIYYMRVRAHDEDVTKEAWSETEAFRVLNRKVN